MAGAWAYCYNLQSLNLSGWDVSSVTNLSAAWQNCYSLVDYWPSVISINHNYDSAAALSIASLLRIIDSLPIVTVARTLTLGQTNKLKLTAEQIAVATQKGWTVA